MAKNETNQDRVVAACEACVAGRHAECEGQCPCAMVGHAPGMEKDAGVTLLSFTMNAHNFAVSVVGDGVRYSIAGRSLPREDFEACVKLAFQLATLEQQQRMAGGLVPGTVFPGKRG